MERYKDIIGGLFWILVAAVMYNASFGIRILAVGSGSTSFVGSGFMPRVIAVGMMIFGAIVVWQGIKKLRASAANTCAKEQGLALRDQYLPVVVSMGLLVLYIAFMEKAGFMIMTAIYLFGQMFILASAEHRKPVMFLVISVVSATAIYYTFVEVFQLMLPESRIF